MKTLIFLIIMLLLFWCNACSKSPTEPNVTPQKQSKVVIVATNSPTPSPTNTPTATVTPNTNNPLGKGCGIPPTPDGKICGN